MTQEFINQCQKNLIDLTARNALINFKFNSGYSYFENRAENGFQDTKFNFPIREKFKEFDINLTNLKKI
jgi:hypothetical protein